MYDYYKILGIDPDANQEAIKRAYRVLIKRHHPDKNPNNKEEALRQTQLLNEAYNVLRDPIKRQEYDNLISLKRKERRSKETTTEDSETTYESNRIYNIKCDKCGRQNSTLRVSIFIWVLGLIFLSYKRGCVYVLCSRCRIRYSLFFNLEVLFLGWWAIYAFFYSIDALIKNMKGGIQPSENNFSLLVSVGYSLYKQGKYNEAYKAIRDSLKFNKDPEVAEFYNYLKQYKTPSEKTPYTDKFFSLHPAWFNSPLICIVLTCFFLAISSANWGSRNTNSNSYFEKSEYQTTTNNNKEELEKIASQYGINFLLFESLSENCNIQISEISSYIRNTLPIIDISYQGNQKIYHYELNRELLDSYEIKCHADMIGSNIRDINNLPNIKNFRQASTILDQKAQELIEYLNSRFTLSASAYFNARLLELSIPIIKDIYSTGELSKSNIESVKKIGENTYVAKWLISSAFSGAYRNLLSKMENYLKNKKYITQLNKLENSITNNEQKLKKLKIRLDLYERIEHINAYNDLVDTNNNLIYLIEDQIKEYNSLYSQYENFIESININDFDIDGAFNDCLDPGIFFIHFEYVDLHSDTLGTENRAIIRK